MDRDVTVIDLLTSDESDSSDDEVLGENCISRIVRDHFPELQAASQSQEQIPQQQHPKERVRDSVGETIQVDSDTVDSDTDGDSNASCDNSDVDYDSDSDHHKVQSLEFLRNHCWACHLWVHHPGLIEVDENPDEICYNALHLHPVLNVPVCVVCAETIETVERKKRPDRISDNREGRKQERNPEYIESTERKETDKDMMTCHACGSIEDGDEDYVRCGGCSRAVCRNCSLQAHHSIDNGDGKNLSSTLNVFGNQTCVCCSSLDDVGGVDGDGSSSRGNSHNNNNKILKTKRDDRSKFNLPPFLQNLRSLTRELFSSSTSSKEGRKSKETLEDALDELYSLETEKRKCESLLDDPTELLIQIREELWEEFDGETHLVEDDIFEIRVHERYEKRCEQWKNHQTRLLDRISILGDRLKSEYDIEATAALRFIETIDNGIDQPTKNELEEIDPSWKQDADNELSKRENEERLKKNKEYKRLAQKRSNDPKYLLEIEEDAEDLGSSGEDDSADNDGDDGDDDNSEPDAYDNGWRNAPFKAQKKDIEAAREAEDRRRVQEGKSELIVRSKHDDTEEIKDWDAGMKSSAMMVKKKNKKRKRLQTRVISLPNGIKPSEAMTASPARSHPSFRRRIRNGNGNENNIHGRKAFLAADEPIDDSNIDAMVPMPKGFQSSSFVLSESPFICIPGEFDLHLKEHQKEGIKFMYKNAFSDLGCGEEKEIGGCILAHSMGLGKSFACVSLLYAVMVQPSLFDLGTSRGKIHKCLLVVPVNTIANWEDEFDKWTKGIKSKLTIFNVSSADKRFRRRIVKQWSQVGGVLLTSVNLFRSMAKIEDIEKLLSATDVIVLDESHTMLKKKENLAYKSFMKIKTRRRICLTGTPFQNNLLEYYHMVSFIRPNLLGESEKKFQKEYMDPIQSSMGSDAPEEVKILADKRLTEFVDRLEPFIHRRDASLLRKDLPSLQQICLHVPPTKMQRAFYGTFREHQEVTNEKNFLKQYAALRNVHNHPGTLLFRNEKPKGKPGNNTVSESKRPNLANISSKEEKAFELTIIKKEDADIELSEKDSRSNGPSEPDGIIEILSSSDEEEDDRDETQETNNKWWTKAAKKFGAKMMKRIESGNKSIILLHILAHATALGEKTVVFSQSLKTLDFLSEMIASKDWHDSCPHLKEAFPDRPMGGWVQGKDFLRIDGGTSGIERGELLKDFSDDKCLKLFLISSVAGGIGINLVSASRVVLFDSHFNPTIDQQAVFRCYRYGQKRNVFAYRLLTQGTMEEKVYSRAVNKTSLGNRVIDGRKLHRCFEKDEIDSLSRVDDWVECVHCGKWRMFPPHHTEDIANLPDDWSCELMNKHDARLKLTCEFEEKDSVWYYHHFKKPNQEISDIASPRANDTELTKTLSKSETEKLVERDEILKNILSITSGSDSSASIVSKYYFSYTLLTDNNPVNGNEKETNDGIAATSILDSAKRKLNLNAQET